MVPILLVRVVATVVVGFVAALAVAVGTLAAALAVVVGTLALAVVVGIARAVVVRRLALALKDSHFLTLPCKE